jgi:hypothetical protein
MMEKRGEITLQIFIMTYRSKYNEVGMPFRSVAGREVPEDFMDSG